MNTYDFTLKYRLAGCDENPERYLGALAEAGCEDAAVGLGRKGQIALHFLREAESAEDAVRSAIADVGEALPEAKLAEVTPDFVGVTDVARLFDVSRQYVGKLIETKRDTFPEPVHEGNPSLWHLADVLTWFDEHDARKFSKELLEVSKVNLRLNARRVLDRHERTKRSRRREASAVA